MTLVNGLVKHTPTLKNDFLTSFDSIFDDLFENRFPEFKESTDLTTFGKASYPKVDVLDYEDRLVIEAEIPGLTKKDLTVKIHDNVLTIRGEKRESTTSDEKEKQPRYILKELKRSRFQRSFMLSDELDHNSLKAKFENGVLNIDIKRKKPKKISERNIKIE